MRHTMKWWNYHFCNIFDQDKEGWLKMQKYVWKKSTFSKYVRTEKFWAQKNQFWAKQAVWDGRLQIIARPPAYRNQICIWIISIYYLVPIIRMKYVFGLWYDLTYLRIRKYFQFDIWSLIRKMSKLFFFLCIVILAYECNACSTTSKPSRPLSHLAKKAEWQLVRFPHFPSNKT